MNRRIIILASLTAMLLAGFVIAGCGQKAEAEMATCECGASYPKSETQIVDGKALCPKCAAAASEKPAEEMLVCADCGMKMAASDMVMVDGKPYCSHCRPMAAAEEEAKEAAKAVEEAAEGAAEEAAEAIGGHDGN